MPDIHCYSYVEDQPSAEAVKKIVKVRNDKCDNTIFFRRGFPAIMKGSGNIRKNAPSFLKMAQNGLYTFTITDLDTTECVPELIQNWFYQGSKSVALPKEVIFRVAIREIESWIIADRSAFAKFIEIPRANFPKCPDDLPDSKQYLLSLIRKKGRKKWHKEMLPKGSAHIGPRYNEVLCDFVRNHWAPNRAADNSPSLKRTLTSLYRL